MAEINWGKYALISETKHNFKEEPEWWWAIKPVTSGMEIEYAKFLNASENLIGIEIAHRQIALTFGRTNIPRGDKPDEPILKEGATVDQVETMLNAMPPDMVMEIWNAVGDAYPFWGPAKRIEQSLSEDELEEIRKEEEGKEVPNLGEEQ